MLAYTKNDNEDCTIANWLKIFVFFSLAPSYILDFLLMETT